MLQQLRNLAAAHFRERQAFFVIQRINCEGSTGFRTGNQKIKVSFFAGLKHHSGARNVVELTAAADTATFVHDVLRNKNNGEKNLAGGT